MKGRLPSRNNLKIISATSVVIFTLLVSFMGVYSWFETVRNNNNLAGDIKVTQQGKFSKLSFYELVDSDTDKDGNPTNFYFTTTASGYVTYDWETREYDKKGDTNVTLEEYSPLDRNHPYLAIIELNNDYKSDEGNITVNLTTDTIGFLGALENSRNKYSLGPESELKVSVVDGVVYYPLSSVTTFSYLALSSTEYNSWINNKTTFDIDVDTLSETEEHKFVTPVNTQQTSTFDNNITIYNSEAGDTVKYIAIVIDYYFDAIDAIYSTFLGDATLESDDYKLNFLCDWEWNVL